MEYICLSRSNYNLNEYSISPYRAEDMFLIMNWRNEQIAVLRQNKLLTKDEQIQYYHNYIEPSFSQITPKQILFSFLFKNTCIGYGGLTNLDWVNKKAELSFLVETQRAKNDTIYKKDFSTFITLMKTICFEELNFNRLFTETYEFRKYHISILEENGFIYEGTLRQNVLFENKFINSHIHSIISQDYGKHI